MKYTAHLYVCPFLLILLAYIDKCMHTAMPFLYFPLTTTILNCKPKRSMEIRVGARSDVGYGRRVARERDQLSLVVPRVTRGVVSSLFLNSARELVGFVFCLSLVFVCLRSVLEFYGAVTKIGNY